VLCLPYPQPPQPYTRKLVVKSIKVPPRGHRTRIFGNMSARTRCLAAKLRLSTAWTPPPSGACDSRSCSTSFSHTCGTQTGFVSGSRAGPSWTLHSITCGSSIHRHRRDSSSSCQQIFGTVWAIPTKWYVVRVDPFAKISSCVGR